MSRRQRHDNSDDHKALQLCRQVERAISASLASDFEDDDVLLSLYIEEVRPAPDASRVLVIARADGEHDIALARERLESVSKWLREEVALSIHRKRVPELTFLVLEADATYVGR